ncbi:very large low complexity [Pyrenophora seminiperda CCB06]|uniref:ubiquitinyl hydrolase 1 n=1 Tax=Pyrenophora seminiperda CCB06 TaxID=1302712 RepID=A0A3M7M1C4_9PLEO|nr:very large low complexity [Pyrenophora seminiperda CCB06]
MTSTVLNLRQVRNTSGFISDSQLQDKLHGLASGMTFGAIPLEIKAQNAAVIISKQGVSADVIFEVFELSPPNEIVMRTKGRLKRSFPTSACQITPEQLQEKGLIESLSQTLGKMSYQEAPELQPQTHKHGQDHVELRDTTNPGLITDMFIHILYAIGQSIDVQGVWKNTREDVLWHDTLLPWRRSPLWLLVRTTMQLQFTRYSSPEVYKAVMVNLLARVLQSARIHEEFIGTDLLYVISAKLTRRVEKLRSLVSENSFAIYTRYALELLRETRSLMKNRIQRFTDSVDKNMNMTLLASLQPCNELDIHLPQVDAFVANIFQRKRQSRETKFLPSITCLAYLEHELPTNFNRSGEYAYFYLAEVEKWVEDHLSSWMEWQIYDPTKCKQLCQLLNDYYCCAIEAYATVSCLPRSLSIMYLTVTEIWIACDKCACTMYPLLREFDPELHLSSFQSLSLPFKKQLERLLAAEVYLQSRKSNAKPDAPSLYRDFGHPQSFAVKFFDGSSAHQKLLERIEGDAEMARQLKREELNRAKQMYQSMMNDSEKLSCDYLEVQNQLPERISTEHPPEHSLTCKKCCLQSMAAKLRIQVHEWPLSSNQEKAKATVFELQVPESYSYWRDITMFFLRAVLSFIPTNNKPPSTRYHLKKQHGLVGFWSSRPKPRISLLSEVKPLTGTHYREKRDVMSLSEADVCVDNALQYRYFDNSDDIFNEGLLPTEEVSISCTYKLPTRAFQLEAYLREPTSHAITPNRVIAGLSDCPPHFSLDEYKAFGSLPIGYRLQYQNILVQIAMPTIDLAKVETQCLLLQILHRAGPQSNQMRVERTAHEILATETFCQALIEKIEYAIERVRENWETWRAASSLVQLILRILTITTSERISSICLELLEEFRKISLTWLKHLRDRVSTAANKSQRKQLSSRLTEIGLLCTSTFDMDGEYLRDILCCKHQISALVYASVVVQENKDVTSSEHDYLHRDMLQSWRLLLFRAFPMLAENISADNFQQGLNNALMASWASFRPTNRWSILSMPRNHWIHVESDGLVVHYNLLTAEVLVNGSPLSRLPEPYVKHEVYSSLFNKFPLEVRPSTEPGMEFSAKHSFHSTWCYKLSLGMVGSDMLILAARDGKKYDLVPSHLFKSQLPTIFVEDYFHWYDHKTDEIEFRHRDAPWDPTNALWRLKRSGTSWRFLNGSKSLINPFGNIGSNISDILASLELQSQIHISYDRASCSILIELPRRRLSFHYTPGKYEIHSHQYQGMIIDTDQQIGTLSGLSKLILKHERRVEDRLALIPEGVVSFSTTETGCVSVWVELDTARATHAYQVDEVLGRLIDDGSLQSKLYLCYLHALTSHCLPDALTGHTGTETALSILRCGAVSSFDVLSEDDINMLELIARLTPERRFYPAHLETMQEVCWEERLSFMSQHPSFYTAVDKLFSISRKTKLLHRDRLYPDAPKLTFANRSLLERDMIRTASFRVDGFGAEHYTYEMDRYNEARARVSHPGRGPRCASTAGMMFRNEPTLHSPIESQNLLSSLEDVFHNATVQGLNGDFNLATLKYDASWLAKPSSFLPDIWCNLHFLLATSPDRLNKFDLMIWLSTAAFADFADMNLVQTLAAFYNCSDLSLIEIPSDPAFDLAKGYGPALSAIKDLAGLYQPRDDCPEYNTPRAPGETKKGWKNKRKRDFESNQSSAATAFAAALCEQWPTAVPTMPHTLSADIYLRTESVMPEICGMFQAWHENHRFSQYLEKVSNTLAQQNFVRVKYERYRFIEVQSLSIADVGSNIYRIHDIFSLRAPVLPVISMNSTLVDMPKPLQPLQIPIEQQTSDAGTQQAQERLIVLCRKLRVGAKSSSERDYILDLRDSCDSLVLREAKYQIHAGLSSNEIYIRIEKYLGDCRNFLRDMNSVLRRLVESGDNIAAQTDQSPRISPKFWVSQLNRDRFDILTIDWKTAVINYGLAVTELHRARRLLALSYQPHELAEELRNHGHQNWSPMDFPETLLLEIESGLLVREVQEEIAKQMRSPPNAANSVMQLNMGEGKSSVIVPIIAAFLAQGELLVRVIVAKPQSRQMFQMLVSKLGGLLNRRVYHMPFSRDLKLGASEAEAIAEIYEDCMVTRGIMLVQPEHILSLKLMGIECLLNGKPDIGRSLLRTQKFFENKSRDIVDESDENFSVRFELIYTMGTQRPVELSPKRWSIIHAILGIVIRYAKDVKRMFPASIEFDSRWGARFPRTRILGSDAEEKLLDLISEHICKVGIVGLHSVARQPFAVKQMIFRYIRNKDLSPEDVDQIENGTFWAQNIKGPLLLIRGLIAGGVLSFTLKSKRWRVNYGLDLDRIPETRVAVPYRSKDSPSLRSEFSHPDVVITLTSLTYYYGGLTDQDLFDTFAHLEKSDQADTEYRIWIRSARALPEAFHYLTGVNIKDRYQCTTSLFPLLRYSKGAIDYYLSHLVFPKAMMEFPHKLSASGWDLGTIKSHPTTGFSGTNDSRHVLPLSVRYLDSEKQNYTNALVLAYILQDENGTKLLPPYTNADCLLEMVNAMEPPAQVILDAGAQILELSNMQVAEKWLRMCNLDRTKAKAVVFFNDEELSVLDPNGRIELLQTSPFAKDLDGCLVYLDQAHTRGTDLKLPKHYRAAVTLGANLTKDSLVQACMRMRKLGKGQSIIFCIPEEIQTQVLERTAKERSTEIDVSDVLTWAITETWADMRRSIPLWATQGHRYEYRKDCLNGAETTFEQAHQFIEQESQSLEDRYRPLLHKSLDTNPDWDTTNKNICKILERCRDFEATSFDRDSLHEEQERELAPENEGEREVQRPAPMEAERHKLHSDLIRLVITGMFHVRSDGFFPAFNNMELPRGAERLEQKQQLPTDLLVTADFMRTVRCPGSSVTSSSHVSASYLRPVQWILSVLDMNEPSTSRTSRRLVIISPFEAEHLLPAVQKSNIVTMHLYAPRVSLGFFPLDTLDLYCVGRAFSARDSGIHRSQIVQLNLFAGQLYFASYAEYVELCKCLGLASEAPEEGEILQADGFIMPPTGDWGLEKSPVRFLKQHFAMRREGQSIEKTHLGRVLEGGLLESREFRTQ